MRRASQRWCDRERGGSSLLTTGFCVNRFCSKGFCTKRYFVQKDFEQWDIVQGYCGGQVINDSYSFNLRTYNTRGHTKDDSMKHKFV